MAPRKPYTIKVSGTLSDLVNVELSVADYNEHYYTTEEEMNKDKAKRRIEAIEKEAEELRKLLEHGDNPYGFSEDGIYKLVTIPNIGTTDTAYSFATEKSMVDYYHMVKVLTKLRQHEHAANADDYETAIFYSVDGDYIGWEYAKQPRPAGEYITLGWFTVRDAQRVIHHVGRDHLLRAAKTYCGLNN